jgi:hypothetical protein
MKKAHAPGTQMTIRHVPPAIDRALRRKARASGKSINEVALDALAAGTGLEGGETLHHDLDAVFGTWVEETAMDEALAAHRRIDAELWK